MISNSTFRYLIKFNRFYSNINGNQVRVRFAPSPTGFLHLGGLRSALYNFLFAKVNNGQFILRIEDTDRNRLVSGATEKLIEDIQWSGIQIDEGPLINKGNYGPYIQSERLDIYKKEVKKLIENGNAYYCFCGERRLELLRKEAVRLRQVPKYDNKCRHLTPSEVDEKLVKNNNNFCIRFKLNSDTESFDDIIYGKISYNVADNEGDPVIIKADGYPTYHFANVIDDHFMQITHVLRGVEWQISTIKHILIYKAFSWQPPKYGHLPLLINADGTKLSKRQGDIQISNYREKGFFPQALLNYITLAGGGYNRQQNNKIIPYTIADLISQFDITKVNSHPSKLNPELLPECNRQELKRLLKNDEDLEKIIETTKNMIETTYRNKNNLDLDPTHIKNILTWTGSRVETLNDLIGSKWSFLWIKPNQKFSNELSQADITILIKLLEATEFEKNNLQTLLKSFAKNNNVKFSVLMKILRIALSGLSEGPGVAEMMEILGKNVTLKRIDTMLK